MKKIISVILAAAILLTACGKDKENDENKNNSLSNNISHSSNKSGKYIDGTYTAKWETYVDGWQEFVILEIQDDIITILQYDAVDKDGNFRSTNEEDNEKYAENNEKCNLPVMTHKEKFKAINDSFYNGDKNTKKMECVAGATRSTERFKLLVRAIINGEGARNTGNPEIVYVSAYGDGIYRVEESKFSSGWKDFVVLEVKNGKPQIIEYDSFDADGNLKSQDEDYKNRMISYTKPRKCGELYPEKYQEIMMKEFNEIDDGNYDDIEGVAGATASSDIFKELVERALYNASIRGKEKDAIYKYVDGEYHAEMSEYIDGWKDYVDIKIENDEIYILDFNSVNATGQKKTDSEEVKKAMINGNAINNLPETYPEKYRTDIISAFSRSGLDVIEMENISGATLSTNNFKIMIGEILRRCAVDGKIKNIAVEPYNIG